MLAGPVASLATGMHPGYEYVGRLFHRCRLRTTRPSSFGLPSGSWPKSSGSDPKDKIQDRLAEGRADAKSVNGRQRSLQGVTTGRQDP